jgi:polyhydroxybutyrate depolymerase
LIARRALPLALAIALAMPGCRCNAKKKAPTVTPIQQQSTILPQVTYAWSEGMTRTSIQTTGGRRYLVVEPQELAPERRYPLVLVFHGDGGDAVGLHTAWPFEHATGKDAFVVYPDGTGRTWDLETKEGNPDIRFVELIIEEVASHHPIDRARVFAAGYSSGGFMANVIACHRPRLFRAISSSAGGAPFKQEERWSNGYPKCPGQEPVAMLALHGDRDWDVTPDSGRFSAEYWAYVNGCATDQMETTGYPECQVYRGCAPGKAVGFCSIPALGHWVWTASAEASWTFFERQAR